MFTLASAVHRHFERNHDDYYIVTTQRRRIGKKYLIIKGRFRPVSSSLDTCQSITPPVVLSMSSSGRNPASSRITQTRSILETHIANNTVQIITTNRYHGPPQVSANRHQLHRIPTRPARVSQRHRECSRVLAIQRLRQWSTRSGHPT